MDLRNISIESRPSADGGGAESGEIQMKVKKLVKRTKKQLKSINLDYEK